MQIGRQGDAGSLEGAANLTADGGAGSRGLCGRTERVCRRLQWEKTMDTTASSFTLRKNAKRAAEAMIRKGIAPAVDLWH